MKRILLALLLISTPAYATVTCDSEKTVDGVDICVVNVPLDIPKSLINSGAIDMFANNQGYPMYVKDPNCTPKDEVTCPTCTPSDAVTCTPEEEANGCAPHDAVVCQPCTPSPKVVCNDIPNPMTREDFCKGLIRASVRERFRDIYKRAVVDASTKNALENIDNAFPKDN